MSAIALSRVASSMRVSTGVGATSFIARVAVARRSAFEIPGSIERSSAIAAPSARSRETSIPASKRMSRSRAHPPQASGSPTTAKLQAPARVGVIHAPNQS